MPCTNFLGRIRELLSRKSGIPPDDVKRAMSDQELARVIREFQEAAISDWTHHKAAQRSPGVSRANSPTRDDDTERRSPRR